MSAILAALEESNDGAWPSFAWSVAHDPDGVGCYEVLLRAALASDDPTEIASYLLRFAERTHVDVCDAARPYGRVGVSWACRPGRNDFSVITIRFENTSAAPIRVVCDALRALIPRYPCMK